MVTTQIRQLTSAEYYGMMESGIIREGERVELISGQIFTMAAKGTRHTLCTRKLFKHLLSLIGDRADVQSQDPITLPNNSEPEPDLVIARLRSDEYVNSHPAPEDIILVIEVADSTLKFVGEASFKKHLPESLCSGAGTDEVLSSGCCSMGTSSSPRAAALS